MPPPLASIGFGDPLPTGRDTWLALIQGGRDALTPPQGQDAPVYREPVAWAPTCTVLVVNATGSALPAFAVVALSGSGVGIDPTVEPELARATPVFAGSVPTGYLNPFAVLVEPAAVGATVRGAVFGAVPCQVTIATAGDGYAGPAAALSATAGGTSSLVSLTAGGPARIVWQSGTSGTVTALVLLQNWAGGGSSPPPPPPAGVSSFTGDGTLITNSTSTGAVTATITSFPAHSVLAGPSSGSGSAAPTVRQLVLADVPDLSSLYVTPSQLTTDLAPYLTGATAASTYVPQSQLGVASGVAQLDSGGHLTASQIPAAVVLTSDSYSDPAWITSLSASVVTGLVSATFTEDTVAAAGTNQATAAALTDATTTVVGANGTKGVILANTPGPQMVYNDAGSSLSVYPPTGGQIVPNAVNSPLVMSGGSQTLFWRLSSGVFVYTAF